MNILGVRIDNLSKKDILEKIESFLDENKFHQIVTVNPEFVLEAQRNEEFKNILNEADLNIADGIGIFYAFLRFGKWLKYRFSGIDLMYEILKMADEKKLSVLLAANKNGLSSWEETRDALLKIYPNIQFSGDNIDPQCHSGLDPESQEILKPRPRTSLDSGRQVRDDNSEIKRCNIVFCAFGAPQQEIFIQSVKDDIMGVAMGVGGSFDFVTGKVKRAPKIMRNFGLEWLWRFIQEPKYRFKRIFNAVIIFPIKVLFFK